MWTIFYMQWRRTIKKPALLLLFFGLTILMVNVIAGSQGNESLSVSVYSDELDEEALNEKVDLLNRNEQIHFNIEDPEAVRDAIRLDHYGFALVLGEGNYQILMGREVEQLPVVNQYIRQFYSEENRLNTINEDITDSVINRKESIKLKASSLTDFGSEVIDLSVMLGLTFYFTIFSILYLMINLFEEKKNGIWNRLIFSPVSKIKIYLGHLLFYFSLGVFQIFILVIILTQMLSIELNINYSIAIPITLAFILSTVSLGILLTAVAKTASGLQVLIPIVATSTAMLGGAFWPIQSIENNILKFIAELMPIKQAIYGIVESFTQNKTFLESMQPVGVLILMSLLFMSLGINLMERSAETSL